MARRILVLNERDLENPLAGGAEVHVFEILRRLVARGHEVRLLAASFAGAPPTTVMQGVAVRRLANRYLYYAYVLRAARRAVRRDRPDVVIDVLNKFPFFSPWVLDVPCCAIVHHLFGATAFRQVPAPVALATFLAEKLVPRVHARSPMLAISESTKTDLVQRGIAAEHVVVVPPGIDLAVYHPAPAAESSPPRMIWIGRLEPYKRVDVALDAFVAIRRQIPDVRLTIVGSGSARADLERHATTAGVAPHVEFTGFVPEDRKVALLQSAAVLINTSEKEGWGLTAIEANACGVPAVSTDVPGLRDAVRDGETGLLVPYGDAGALADAVVRVLQDPGLRARLIAAGREWAARFSWERAAVATEALIESAIAGRAAWRVPAVSTV